MLWKRKRKEEKEDTASLKARQKEKTAGRQRTLELINAKNHSLQEARKIRKSLQEKEKKRKVLEREYGIVKDLDNMASGNNAKRLVFEQYVMAGYFEEILRAANVRLAKMTGGVMSFPGEKRSATEESKIIWKCRFLIIIRENTGR